MAPSDMADPTDLRTQVVAASIRLFSENGYESTTVDQIAAAAGVSRRTLFRQFRSKEDMIFGDHEALLAQVAERLTAAGERADDDPWSTVCDAAEIVFVHFHTTRDLAVRRLRVVQKVPALRERELVTTTRYQRLFEDYLRTRLPGESPVRLIGFAGAVTAAHNYLLRAMIRGEADATLARLRTELTRIRLALGAGSWESSSPQAIPPAPQAIGPVPQAIPPAPQAITVVTYPLGAGADDVAEAVRRHLGASTSGCDRPGAGTMDGDVD
ncbi:TetR/AcrR family transcriptional regulator [Gordonia sp. NB41Y]|uniref:TetR/AcrR family transcriptional regulator n=1 Tax=Gordonia sp. NB41Y TaxID=875808 RepID=UPI0006B20A78|nr:TetR/AcrR family transcriptional regulator [Gordonia sp. NB41Y]EMP12576.2 TetR family transcriptional regulator [Gordonia sp. NB41Y]WLP92220.1 TetR/AcrR family transcriptional regulator [Gordonia sp. NB41Y]